MNNNDLKVKDISDCVDEEISMDNMNAYKQQGFFTRLPYWLKAIFIKYWFFGSICFFVLMGSSLLGEDAALFAGALAGAIFDMVVYNILIMMDSDENESRHYIIYKSKKIWSLFINIAYNTILYFSKKTALGQKNQPSAILAPPGRVNGN